MTSIADARKNDLVSKEYHVSPRVIFTHPWALYLPKYIWFRFSCILYTVWRTTRAATRLVAETLYGRHTMICSSKSSRNTGPQRQTDRRTDRQTDVHRTWRDSQHLRHFKKTWKCHCCQTALATDRFLSRVSILLLTRDIDIAILSVRPSVRLSVTRWYCMKTA